LDKAEAYIPSLPEKLTVQKTPEKRLGLLPQLGKEKNYSNHHLFRGELLVSGREHPGKRTNMRQFQ